MADPRIPQDADLTPQERHQIVALTNKIGRACSSKSADVVGVALGIVVADMIYQIAKTEQEAIEGLEDLFQDVANQIGRQFAARRKAH